MRRRRRLQDERSLCSGPGKLTEALGITHAQNAKALDAPPFALHARKGPLDVVAGVLLSSVSMDATTPQPLAMRYVATTSAIAFKPVRHPRE